MAKFMAVLVVAAVLCCGCVVAPAEGRALLNIGKLIDHLKPGSSCSPPPPSDPTVPAPYSSDPGYSEPSPVSMSPPYSSYAPPSPVDPSPPVFATPPPGGY